ncbi:MAG: hypothetical protein ABJQ29_14770 [Luteolibacter sp.]
MQDASQGVSGPCPNCNTWIDASQFSLQKELLKGLDVQLPTKSALQQRRSRSVVSGRGRIRADGYLDQEYGERKELYGTIKVLAVSLSVLALILFITLYMKQWLAN